MVPCAVLVRVPHGLISYEYGGAEPIEGLF